MQNFQTIDLWRFGVSLLLLLLAVAYVRGWRRMRTVQPHLASRVRLVAFVISMAALAGALISPVETWTDRLLVARALQKVLLCMVAAPFFWLAGTFHFVAWGLPTRWRRGIGGLLRNRSQAGRLLRNSTQPGFTWLLFVSSFLIWHDPAFVNYTMAHTWLHRLTLCGLGLAAILFWWHIVGGPRIHTRFPDWVRFASLVGVEIPNIVSGIAIAFASTPLYSYYALAHAAAGYPLRLTVIEDQMLSGGIIWVFGSMTYFYSAVMVLNKIFRDNDGNSARPLPNWDADARMIAPGLEHRVRENRYP